VHDRTSACVNVSCVREPTFESADLCDRIRQRFLSRGSVEIYADSTLSYIVVSWFEYCGGCLYGCCCRLAQPCLPDGACATVASTGYGPNTGPGQAASPPGGHVSGLSNGELEARVWTHAVAARGERMETSARRAGLGLEQHGSVWSRARRRASMLDDRPRRRPKVKMSSWTSRWHQGRQDWHACMSHRVHGLSNRAGQEWQDGRRGFRLSLSSGQSKGWAPEWARGLHERMSFNW
jgi:hypothetical protein